MRKSFNPIYEGKKMLYYPAKIQPDTVGFYATFRDIPEAATCGSTISETREMAEDVLLLSMECYFEDKRIVPMPSDKEEGEILIPLPTSAAAKVLLLNEMISQKVNQVDLAKLIGTRTQEVTRIVDLHHATKIDTIVNALKALGKKVTISVA